jgi:hypothetical protein
MSSNLIQIRPGSRLNSIICRAIVFVPLAMALWWFLLKGSSLWLLRILAYFPLGMLIAPPDLDPVKVNPATNEWVFTVAVHAAVRNTQTGQRETINSLEFAAGQDSIAFFACGWFSYLALAFSAGAFSRKRAPDLLKGIGLQTAINILCLAAFVYINGHGVLINTPNNADPAVWLIKYVYHIIYLVVPFAGPFIVALLVHPEWRAYFSIADAGSPH